MCAFRLRAFSASVSLSVALVGCSAKDVVKLTPDDPAAGGAGGGTGDAGRDAQGGGGSGVASPDCNMKGVWATQMITVTQALSVPQYANSWYYYEIDQPSGSVDWTVIKQFDCGVEVRGSVVVSVPPATLEVHLKHNGQAGRKGTMKKNGAGQCELAAERFWVLLGADDRFLPARNAREEIEPVASRLPLPNLNKPDGAEDWDNDGKLGVSWQVTGVVQGTRNTVQRQWQEWFTNDQYSITPATDWNEIVVRADFDKDESVFDPTEGLLTSPSFSVRMPETPNRFRLRFLGRDKTDPRAAELVRGTDPDGATAATVETCRAMQEALRAVDM